MPGGLADYERALEHLARRGIRLSAQGDELRVSAAKNALSDDLREWLRQHKPGLLDHLRAKAAVTGPIERQPRDGRAYPATPEQRGLWLTQRIDGHKATYVISAGLRIDGDIDEGRLRRCLDGLVERHEALRTVFELDDAGEVVQRLMPPRPVEVAEVDLGSGAGEGQEARLEALVREQAARPFDLASDLMLRAALVRLSAEEAFLLLSVHHIAADAWSMSILVDDLVALYEADADGSGAPAAPELQYVDIASWRPETVSEDMRRRDLAFWRTALEGAPDVIDVASDRPRPSTPSLEGRLTSITIPAELAEAVKRASRAQGGTLFMALLAAWAVVLSRHSGSDDVVVGSPVNNRERPELERVVGFFVRTMPLRVDCGGDVTLGELITRARAATIGAYTHQALAFEELVSELAPRRSASHAPVFQSLFGMHGGVGGALRMGSAEVRAQEVHNGTAKFDLTLMASEEADGIEASLEFATDLFDAATAERLLRQWSHVLEQLAEDPGQRVSEVSLLTSAEREELLALGRGRETGVDPDGPVHAIVGRQAVALGSAPAVEFGGEVLTYKALDALSDRIAAEIAGRGVPPGSLVAMRLRRGPLAVATMLGILKSGRPFVAVDVDDPPERQRFVLEDTGAPILLASRETMGGAAGEDGPEVMLVDDLSAQEGLAAAPDVPFDPDALAYVIYTSGSGGRPKGVAMPHRSLANMVRWQSRAYPARPDERTLQFAPFTFDIFLQELFSTWNAGATAVLVDEETRRAPDELLAHLVEQRVTRLFVPYVALRQLCEVARSRSLWPETLRDVFAAGEQLRVTPDIRVFFERTGATLHNHYGPTEAHVVSAHTLDGPPAEWPELPPIGRPIDNARFYVLDEAGRLAPPGVAGDLHVGGNCLAHGYLGRPELTAERFLEDPFVGGGARVYKTGDFVRIDADGLFHFLGRADNQVKVRGFRVELEEIEQVLTAHDAVAQAAAAVRPGAVDNVIVGYVVLGDGDADEAELRAHCERFLPGYMVPGRIMLLDELPLTVAGKVERRALPDLPAQDAEPGDGEPADDSCEAVVAAVYAEVLDRPGAGPGTDFYDAGGHSLAATQIATRISDRLGVDLPVRDVFEHHTVGLLARRVDALRAEAFPAGAGRRHAEGREVGEI